MGIWKHRLSNKDIKEKKADCSTCGKGINIIRTGGIWKCYNSRKWHSSGHWKIWKYRVNFIDVEKRCEICGLENEEMCFFDVNHKDSNHSNNKIENLELICPNCHRLETMKLWKKIRIYG